MLRVIGRPGDPVVISPPVYAPFFGILLAHRYGVTIISDEIHAPLVFGGATHTPLLSLPGATDVGGCVFSASQTWNLAGLKCAAIVTGSTQVLDLATKRMAGVMSR
jgi:bifunctional pyridoxal-dependent enzyme with beta-cystathionase and maltose regulon repressor activities